MRALLLVDIQNDFLPGGALAVQDGDAVIPVAQRVLVGGGHLYDLVVATQDWHPPGHRSFASVHPGRKVGEFVELVGVQQILWPDHCVQGTVGAGLAPGLTWPSTLKIFQKGMNLDVDSYSGFFDNARRVDTGLGEWLKSHKVDQLLVMGLATDYCVKATVIDGLSLGFAVTVIVDGCRGVNVNEDDGDSAISEMVRSGSKLITSEQLFLSV